MTAARREKLEIVLELDSMTDLHVLETVINTGNFHAFFVDGQLIGADELRRKVKAQSKWNQVLEADGLAFRFGVVKAYRQCFLQIQESRPDAAESWVRWVAPFLAQVGFVQAWVADFEYDYWQNAADPLLYEAEGRDYSRLPMKSNDLPPPVQQQIIDTSKNPGRWSLQQGYVEAIGATMWLGQAFFRYVGESIRRSLLATAWPEVEVLSDRVLKLSAAPSCFKDESNAAAQVELRKRLYKVE